MKLKPAYKLLIAIVIPELAGGLGSVVTIPAISNWYVLLTKPTLNPPSWIFGPVWTTLYLLMGVAAFLIWNKGIDQKGVRKALDVFLLQLWDNTHFAWHEIRLL